MQWEDVGDIVLSSLLFSALISIPLITALTLDAHAVIRMFGLPQWVHGLFPGEGGGEMSLGSVERAFRGYNWAASVVFVVTTTQLLSAMRRGEALLLLYPFHCLLACLSMLYLLAFFGVSLVYSQVQEAGKGKWGQGEDTHTQVGSSGGGAVKGQVEPFPKESPGFLVNAVVYAACSLVYVACVVVPVLGVAALLHAHGHLLLTSLSQLLPEDFALFLMDRGAHMTLAVTAICCAVGWGWERRGRGEGPGKVQEERVQRERTRLASYTQGYPNGWFRLCSTSDLREGEVKSFEVLGLSLVAFRAESGAIAVFDAYCPHLGAHLGVGGTVCGEELQCPFHQWKFDIDGNVACVPYAPRASPPVKLRKWPSIQYLDQVLFFHDRDEAIRAKEGLGVVVKRKITPTTSPTSTTSTPTPTPPSSAALLARAFDSCAFTPPYVPPSIPQVESGEMVYRGCYFPDREVKMSLLEFAENSADTRHFDAIHSQLAIPWTSIPIPGLTITHAPGWQRGKVEAEETVRIPSTSSTPLPPTTPSTTPSTPPPPTPSRSAPKPPFFAHFTDAAYLRCCGRPIPHSGAMADITFVGPGGVALFRFDVPGLAGPILLLQCHTPSSALSLRVSFHYWAHKGISPLLVSYVVGNWVGQWRNDLDIWENKVFQPKPVLVRGDGPMMAMRAWLKQFYKQGSPRTKVELERKRTEPAEDKKTAPKKTVVGCAVATAAGQEW